MEFVGLAFNSIYVYHGDSSSHYRVSGSRIYLHPCNHFMSAQMLRVRHPFMVKCTPLGTHNLSIICLKL